jgi:hypothetical protein
MSGWKPIETAPKDGTIILISPRPGLAKYLGTVRIGKWAERNGRWSFGEVAGRNVDPTHWQPLPEPPQ